MKISLTRHVFISACRLKDVLYGYRVIEQFAMHDCHLWIRHTDLKARMGK